MIHKETANVKLRPALCTKINLPVGGTPPSFQPPSAFSTPHQAWVPPPQRPRPYRHAKLRPADIGKDDRFRGISVLYLAFFQPTGYNFSVWAGAKVHRGEPMADRAVLLQEIETLPVACLDDVIDFVVWIKQRKLSNILETMLLSEAALPKDWSTPEEDEAWASL